MASPILRIVLPAASTPFSSPANLVAAIRPTIRYPRIIRPVIPCANAASSIEPISLTVRATKSSEAAIPTKLLPSP